MKSLVVYYSKTGNTKKIAEQIAQKMKADIYEIREEEAGERFHEFKKNQHKDSSEYDLVIVGGPVWAFNVCPQIKKYLIENKSKIKRVAFFCTYAGIKGMVFGTMKRLSKAPVGVLKVRAKDVDSCEKQVIKFCEGLI